MRWSWKQMILDSLILENIRSYGHEEIIFPKGITLFKGDIGSGKSSILMAVEFALFGSGQGGPRSILAKKAHMGYVTLEFTVDEQKYEIKRTIERKNGEVGQNSKNSYIKVNGEKEPLSATELKQRVLEILRFNESSSIRAVSRIYRYAVFTPQEEMQSVLNDSEKRIEMIRKAFGVEDYANAVANSEDLAKKIGVNAALFGDRTRGIDEMQKQNQASKKLIIKTNSEIIVIKEKSRTVEYTRAGIEKEMARLQKKQGEKNILQDRRDQLEDDIADYQDGIESSETEIKNAKKAIDIARVKLDKIKNIKNPTKKTKVEIRAEIENLSKVEKKLAGERGKHKVCVARISGMGKITGKSSSEEEKKAETLQKRVNQIKKTYIEGGKELDRLKRLETENETQSAALRKDIADFTKLGTKCPTCKRGITTDDMNKMKKSRSDSLDGLISELIKIRKDIVDTKKQNIQLDNDIQNTDAEIAKCKQAVSRIKDYEKESKILDKITSDIASVETQYEKLKKISGYKNNPIKNLAKLKDSIVEYEKGTAMAERLKENIENYTDTISKREKDVDKLETDVARNDEKIRDIDVKIKSFKEIDSEMKSVASQLKDASRKVKELDQKLGSLEQILQNEKRHIKDNDKNIADAKKWKMQHAKFSEYQKWLVTYFKPAVGKIENEIMLSILQNFDEAYRKWYLMLIDDPTKESSIDENFTPSVRQDGFEQDVSSLSGGEKTSVALAYRLTLNSLMRKEAQSLKSNLLILDEPTDGFSRDQMNKVKDVLDELKSKQIILVSHDEELAAYADNVFNVTKENGRSKIVQG